MKVDALAAARAHVEHVVEAPERAGQRIAHAGLAAAITTVAFRHAKAQLMGAGHRDDGIHALGNTRIRGQQVFNIRLRAVGRTFGVVMTGELEQATL